MTGKAKFFELKGKYVVLGILALTGVVGGLFMYLGPRATRKSPGVLHVGIRYANEQTLGFLRYGKDGPGARIEFINAEGQIAYTFEGLEVGRNLLPIENIQEGPYTVRLCADGFQSLELPVVIEGGILNPAPDFESSPDTVADYNMIGVRFEPEPR